MKRIRNSTELPVLAFVYPDVFKNVEYALLEHMPFLRQPWARKHLLAKTLRETERLVSITAYGESGITPKMVIAFAPPFSSLQMDAEFIDATIMRDVKKIRHILHLPYHNK